MSTEIRRVHIELSRVQTWLFAVPRLRAMVGANALLGETLRVALPKLARETGRGWALAPSSERYPIAHPDDPLNEHDDPAVDAQHGIISRDGGHFEALFTSGAEAFVDAAGQLLRSSLPGLRFRVSIDGEPRAKSQVHLSTELPVLAPCEWTGRGLASAIVEQGDERPGVSLDVAQRHEAARRAEEGTAVDVASLLRTKTKLQKLGRPPQELKDLVGRGYLALIHADGNGVGSGLGKDKSDSVRAEFFHRNRVLLRRALKKAIDVHCPDQGQAPLIPLMLGGDDLLLVARAEIALPFVVTLCAELEALQKERIDFKLTLGIGVAIAKHTIPIHRLHEVAEQLASSSKRRFRGLDADKKCSVVDWAVFTTARVDDPEEVRRRDWLRGSGDDLRVLSQRPVDVLGEHRIDSLQGLLRGARQLVRAPRSQLRYLVDQLPRGRALSELAFAELPQEVRGVLAEAGVTSPWRRVGSASMTALLDLVEATEVSRLGRNSERADSAEEAADV